MKYVKPQLNFSIGEISETLSGRSDTEQHANGLHLCSNMIPTAGGAWIRPPTLMVVAITADAAPQGNLIPFIFSRSENYVISIDSYRATDQIVIYRQSAGAYGPSLTKVYDGSALSATIEAYLTDKDPFKFQVLNINGVMILTHISRTIPPLVIRRTAANTFSVGLYFDVVIEKGNIARGLVFPPLNAISAITATITDSGDTLNFTIVFAN